jgi:hypothetical protein
MDYLRVLSGTEKPVGIYDDIIICLNDIRMIPDMIEPIYRTAMTFDEETLDRFRFALIRLQIYSDIHRYEDLERSQHIKYVAQVLEKIIFGSLLMEHEELANES